ncbi:hypothetical protein ACH4ZX_06360 [Streptomyces sp. NPDC020490]|uniref:hypothetical protein n=1 Tax=Streptomyces sp. NPDC020490 TaxID=3365078 RepID=UPI0037BC141E
MTLNRFLASAGAAALAVAALSGCGGEQAGGQRQQTVDAAGARAATGPGTNAELAFLEMLERVGAPCVPDPPTTAESDDPAPGEHPPTSPDEPLPVDKEPPTEEPPAEEPSPAATAEPVRLKGVEACEGRVHSERVTLALTGLDKPTPRQVARKLNKLGYPGSRVHGLRAERGAVRFSVDLRVMGGQLALKGTAAGGKTAVEAFAHPAEGAFRPGG